MSHGINANVVDKWRRFEHLGGAPLAVAAFGPVALPAPIPKAALDIRIELRRGATIMVLN